MCGQRVSAQHTDKSVKKGGGVETCRPLPLPRARALSLSLFCFSPERVGQSKPQTPGEPSSQCTPTSTILTKTKNDVLALFSSTTCVSGAGEYLQHDASALSCVFVVIHKTVMLTLLLLSLHCEPSTRTRTYVQQACHCPHQVSLALWTHSIFTSGVAAAVLRSH